MKLLIDENISPKTAEFLESQGHDVKSVRETDLGASDKEVVELALEEGRTIITLDDDFGEIYYFSNEERLKVAVLKPVKQKISVINELLKHQIKEIQEEKYGLFIIREEQIRKIR